jgi:hypothetical protein
MLLFRQLIAALYEALQILAAPRQSEARLRPRAHTTAERWRLTKPVHPKISLVICIA